MREDTKPIHIKGEVNDETIQHRPTLREQSVGRSMAQLERQRAQQRAKAQQQLRRERQYPHGQSAPMRQRQPEEVSNERAERVRYEAPIRSQEQPRQRPVKKSQKVDMAMPVDEGQRLAEQPVQPSPDPRRAPKKPPKKRRGCGCLFYVILVLLVIVGAVGALWAYRANTEIKPISAYPADEQASVAQSREAKNVYILFAGTDARENEPARSDTMIFAAFRPSDRKIDMVSIPRDTLVSIPGEGEDKINAAHAYGGNELMDQTVENFLDNRVDHTVVVDFKSFPKVIDAMGGIDMDVEARMYLPEENIDLQKGQQHLNGEQALAYVRWRGDGNGDLGRITRQKKFMDAVIAKMRHLTPWRAVRVARALSQDVDTDMNFKEMLALGYQFIGMRSDALEFRQFEAEPTYINGVSYVLIEKESVKETMDLLRYGVVLDNSDVMAQ